MFSECVCVCPCASSPVTLHGNLHSIRLHPCQYVFNSKQNGIQTSVLDLNQKKNLRLKTQITRTGHRSSVFNLSLIKILQMRTTFVVILPLLKVHYSVQACSGSSAQRSEDNASRGGWTFNSIDLICKIFHQLAAEKTQEIWTGPNQTPAVSSHSFRNLGSISLLLPLVRLGECREEGLVLAARVGQEGRALSGWSTAHLSPRVISSQDALLAPQLLNLSLFVRGVGRVMKPSPSLAVTPIALVKTLTD